MDQDKTIQFVPTRFFESFIAVARELTFRPARFFEQLRPSGSLSGPVIFLVVCQFVSSLLVANVTGATMQLFAAVFVSGIIAMVLGALCLHAMLATPLFNVRLPFEATLNVVAYACIVFLVAWVPLLGIVANVYGLCLMYLGFKAVHRLSASRAGIAVFLMVLQVEFIRLVMLRLTAPEWLDALIQAVEKPGGIAS
jgi:hypothetical protein